MRKEYEDWFRGFYKQEPMPELGAPAHDFCWAGYITGAASRDAEIAYLQSRIDELMLEYCPDEMTQEQIAEYAKHQRAVIVPKEQVK